MCLKTQLSWLFILFLSATKLRICIPSRSRQSFRWQRGPDLVPWQLFQWRLEAWHDTTLTWHHFFASEARKKLLLRKKQTCRIFSRVAANPNFWMISARRGIVCHEVGKQKEGCLAETWSLKGISLAEPELTSFLEAPEISLDRVTNFRMTTVQCQPMPKECTQNSKLVPKLVISTE